MIFSRGVRYPSSAGPPAFTGFLKRCIRFLLHVKLCARLRKDYVETKMPAFIVCGPIPVLVLMGKVMFSEPFGFRRAACVCPVAFLFFTSPSCVNALIQILGVLGVVLAWGGREKYCGRVRADGRGFMHTTPGGSPSAPHSRTKRFPKGSPSRCNRTLNPATTMDVACDSVTPLPPASPGDSTHPTTSDPYDAA